MIFPFQVQADSEETKQNKKKKKKAVPKGAVGMFGGVDLFGGKNPFAHRREGPESEEEEDEEMEAQETASHSNGFAAGPRGPPKTSVDEKPVDIDAGPTSEHVIPGVTDLRNRPKGPQKRKLPSRGSKILSPEEEEMVVAATAAASQEPAEETTSAAAEEEEEVTRTGLKLRRVKDLPTVHAPAEKTEKEKERDLKRQRLEEATKLKKEENRQRKEQEGKKKPKISLTGKPNRKSKEGESFTCEAKVSGEPLNEITWSKDKFGPLKDSEKNKIVREDGFTALTVSNTVKAVSYYSLISNTIEKLSRLD